MKEYIKENLLTYNREAPLLASLYNSKIILDILPDFTKTILNLENKNDLWAIDIGCGSGRDSLWMAEQGLNVLGVDGSLGMLTQAQKHNNHSRICYLEDTAPDFLKTKARKQRFDIILVGAFLHNLGPKERQNTYKSLQSLAQKDTYAHITIRRGAAPKGRKTFDVPLEEIQKFCIEHNIFFKHLGRTEDKTVGREDVKWDYIELRFFESSEPDKNINLTE